MIKLLNKQFRAFTLYALIILISSIPVYFFIIDYIWLDELDEHNEIIARKVTTGFDSLNLNDKALSEMIVIWNKTQPGTNLIPVTLEDFPKDSIYGVIRALGAETDRFRGLTHYLRIGNKPFRLTVETNVEESKETIVAIAGVTILFFIVLVIGFLLLNRRISANAWKPFYDTLQELRTFNLRKHQQINLQESDITEFVELNQALTKLIDTVISSYKEQKEFTENASHELQTPLAIIQSKLDLLLQNEELTSEQYKNIEDINETLTRISRINKNLLLLTKIENNQYVEIKDISVRDIIEKQLDFFLEQATDKNIIIETDNRIDINVKANPALIEILISNLLLNAIKHNTFNGRLIISLEKNTLKVANTGTTQSLIEGRLFQRFARTDTSTAGSGLGLAILKNISDIYKWEVQYEYSGEHHIFTIKF